MIKKCQNVLLCCLASVFAMAICITYVNAETLVSPAGLASVDGNTLGVPQTAWPGGSVAPTPNGFRIQEVHPARGFDVPGPITITGVALRPDQSVAGPVSFTWDMEMFVSTTTKNPLVAEFAANYGVNSEGNAGATQVIARREITASTDGDRDGQPVHDFDYVFEFDVPYTYDPSEGDLLLDWVITDLAQQRTWQDAQSDGGRNAWDASLGGLASQLGSSLVSVTQFTYVPEPSGMTLASVALMACLASLRRCPSPRGGQGYIRSMQLRCK